MPFRIVPRRDRKLNRLVKAGASIELRRGAQLYAPGGAPDHLYLIREGMVRLWLPATNRRGLRTVSVAGPGDLFGFEAVFPSGARRRTYGATAGDRTLLVAMPSGRATLALRTAEKTFAFLMKSIADDLEAARQLGAGRGGPTTSERLADVLLDLTSRFGVPEGTMSRLAIRITHQDLADLAGAHRSTVTTLLNDWIYRRVLKDSAGGLLIRSEPLLKRSSRASPSRAGIRGPG